MLTVESIPLLITILGSALSLSIVIIQRGIMLKHEIKKLKEHESVPYEKHIKNYNRIKLKEV